MSSLGLLILELLATLLQAQQYVVSTVAGGSPPPTPIVAVNASVAPDHVAVDAFRNVYFTSDSCIFKIGADGVMVRIAGNSRPGFSGDGRPALSAQLKWPAGIAVDKTGNIFVADIFNMRVRKISVAGIISTMAGNGTPDRNGDSGPATAAGIGQPRGVAVDDSGNLYIAAGTVRKVSPGGIITTIAGNGRGGFSGDGGRATDASVSAGAVAVDSTGNLYIAEPENNRVRRVTAAGTITTVAGNGTAGYSGDGGPAVNAQLSRPEAVTVDSAGALYIADAGNGRVRKVQPNGFISTVAGTGLALYRGDGVPATSAPITPEDVAIDGTGSYYIADTLNYRVRKVSSSGTISTVAGNGLARYSGDGGPATAAQLNYPWGATADGSGNLYIADTGNNRIRRVSPDGTIVTVAGNGSAGYAGDGGSASQAGLKAPSAVVVDRTGNLYIADTGNSCVRMVSARGTISTVAGTGLSGFSGDGGPATAASLNYPTSLAIDTAGNLYVGDSDNHRIRKVSASGVISTVAGRGSADFSGDGGLATLAGLSFVGGIVLDGNGNLYFSDLYNNRIRRVNAGGIISTVAGNGSGGFGGDGVPAITSSLGEPYGLTIDADGSLYVATDFTVRKVSATGIITTLAGSYGHEAYTGDGGPPAAARFFPSGLAMGPPGNLYIVDGPYNAVRVLEAVVPSITSVTDSAGGGTRLAPGMIVSVSGADLGSQATAATLTVAGRRAPLLSFVDSTRLFVQIPADMPLGQSALTATWQGAISRPFTINLAAFAPAIYDGTRSEVAATLGPFSFTDQSGASITPAHPATPAAVVSCRALGLGPTNPPMVTATAAPAQAPAIQAVQILIGSRVIDADYAGLEPGAIGRYKVTFTVPTDLGPGNQPVTLRVAGQTSNTVMLPVGAALPQITTIVDGAAFRQKAQAPNSFVTIFGTNFGTSDSESNLFPVTSYDGLSVLFDGKPSPLYYVFGGKGQINLVLPAELPESGAVTVTLRNRQGTGPALALKMAPDAVSIFRIPDPSSSNRSNVAALFANTAWRVMPPSMATAYGLPPCEGAPPSTICGQPAKPGDAILLFATGLGRATPGGDPTAKSLPSGSLAPADGSAIYQTVKTPLVEIGGLPAQVLFSGIAPGNAGLYQINVIVPAGVSASDDAPIVLRMPGGSTDQATLPIK